METIAQILNSPQVKALVVLFCVNFIFAVLRAVAEKTFDWKKFPEVVERLVIVVAAYGALALGAAVVPDYGPVRDAAWAILLLAWGKKTAENLLGLIRELVDVPAQS